jgi:putative transposase
MTSTLTRNDPGPARQVRIARPSELAAQLMRETCMRAGVNAGGLVLHSDNGGPMKGSTMLATLQRLGMVPSFSRPAVSNNKPYSEATFRTLKYRPGYPRKPLESLKQARAWIESFVRGEHRHRGIRFVTPDERHSGQDVAVLAKRQAVYEEARRRRPERWTRSTRNGTPVGAVCLNPQKREVTDGHVAELAA